MIAEEILSEPANKYVMYNIRYPRINTLYEQLRDSFWTADEVDLTRDIADWKLLNDNQRLFIKKILTFFVTSDSIIQENLILRFMGEVKALESKAFFSIQIGNEQIHQDMYLKMLTTYIRDEKELEECLNAVYTDKYISKKTKWAESWIQDDKPFKYRVVAFACVEGIFFCSSFAAIYWIKKSNKMPGLTISNEFISRDECRHTDHAIEIFSELKDKLTEEEFIQLVSQSVEVESEFVDDCLKVDLIGMNANLMKQYVRFCADRLSISFGYRSIYNETNPFDFMEMISLNGKTNFFEYRVTTYQKAKNLEMTTGEFVYDEDF